jgi:hypothetical protein
MEKENQMTDTKVDDIIVEADKQYIQSQTSLPGEWKEVKLDCPHCTSDQFVYIYDDDKTCYCCQCDEEFDVSDITGGFMLTKADSTEDREIQQKVEDMVSDDPEVVKQMADRIIAPNDAPKQLPAYQHKTYDNWESGKSYSSFINNCSHSPQQIINGEGWGVWAGKKGDCQYRAKDFDVVLNLTFTSIKEPHIIPIPELQEFEEVDCSYKEIQLDWPDYGTINMPKEFWIKLIEYLEKNQYRMLVFCLGGHGRTGTALAVLMGLSIGYSADQAITWLRRNYCHSAVETVGQENYVRSMLKEDIKVKAKEESQGEKMYNDYLYKKEKSESAAAGKE